MTQPENIIDCACVIHGNAYDWTYVERLHSMLTRNLSPLIIRLHVWTEANRNVPAHMVKHVLEEWPGIAGPRKAWWYKLQMFNRKHFEGRLLYFDLDTVIVDRLDWILALNPAFFWCIRDFKYLWRPTWEGMNSSVMYWNNADFPTVWKQFKGENIQSISRRFAGDQDFLTAAIEPSRRRFFDNSAVQSYRWQVKDGGMNMRTREYSSPNSGATIAPDTKIIIFHGQPKPHEVLDPNIQQHWK